jgi:hypothetical protein
MFKLPQHRELIGRSLRVCCGEIKLLSQIEIIITLLASRQQNFLEYYVPYPAIRMGKGNQCQARCSSF